MKKSKSNPPQDPTSTERDLLKQWLASPAPGEDRLHHLSAPLPGQHANSTKSPLPPQTRPSRKSRRPLFTYAQNIAIAIVLFSAGYFTGQSKPTDSQDHQQAETAHINHKPNASAIPASPTPLPPSPPTEPENNRSASPSDNTPDLSRTIASSTKNQTGPSPADDCKSPQLYRGRDGHFRVDTVLCQSGSRATWVINPGLEIANAGKFENEETHQ